jgi:hypothetical protein
MTNSTDHAQILTRNDDIRGTELTGIYVDGHNVMASDDPPRAIVDTGVGCPFNFHHENVNERVPLISLLSLSGMLSDLINACVRESCGRYTFQDTWGGNGFFERHLALALLDRRCRYPNKI